MGAALEGVRVAGKTGTAELRATQGCVPVEGDPASCPPGSPEDTSAWFNAYAPEDDPQVAIGVLLVGAGTGGGAAAPAAQQVLRAALG
jgi:cell division protein FtsI/penicillin-binding protein 2